LFLSGIVISFNDHFSPVCERGEHLAFPLVVVVAAETMIDLTQR